MAINVFKFLFQVVDIVLCVKGAMKGLMNVSGATYFTISLSAALFTAYYLILFCTCRRTKRTRVSASIFNTIFKYYCPKIKKKLLFLYLFCLGVSSQSPVYFCLLDRIILFH